MNKQDYYVYVHRRLDNNQIFYVGSGRGQRATNTLARNPDWKLIHKTIGSKVEILIDGLTKEESRELEELTISMIGLDNLTNKQLPVAPREMLYSEFAEYFKIDESSPSGLRRIKDVYSTTARKGDVAGSKGPDGYWALQFKKKAYGVHRIIYLLAYKTIDPDMVVDHIDRNKSNNRLSNLRLVSIRDNLKNKNPYTDKFGIGVFKTDYGYSCRWKVGSITEQVTFPFNLYPDSKETIDIVCKYGLFNCIVNDNCPNDLSEYEFNELTSFANKHKLVLDKYRHPSGYKNIIVQPLGYSVKIRLFGKVWNKYFSIDKYGKDLALDFALKSLELFKQCKTADECLLINEKKLC